MRSFQYMNCTSIYEKSIVLRLLKRENAQLTRSVISGFGRCSQRAGAVIGAGPDQYTACTVLNSHSDMLANLQNLYG